MKYAPSTIITVRYGTGTIFFRNKGLWPFCNRLHHRSNIGKVSFIPCLFFSIVTSHLCIQKKHGGKNNEGRSKSKQ